MLKTSQGDSILLRNGYVFTISNGYRWTDLKTELDVKLGESTTAVDFSKIKKIVFTRPNKAKMLTASNKTIEVLVPDYDKLWLGGNFDKYGPARIKLSRVTSLEIGGITEQ